MTSPFILRADAETLTIQLPDSDETLQVPNLLAYQRQGLNLLTIGEGKATLRQQMGREWEAFQKRVVFAQAFDPDPNKPVFDFLVLDYYLAKQHSHSRQPKKRSWKLTAFWPNLDIELWLPDYDRFTPGRRLEMEYYLQTVHQARRLAINGQDVTLPVWKRLLEVLLRLLLLYLAPLGLLYAGAILALRQFELGWENGLAAAALAVGLVLAAYLLGIALWLFVLRYILPASYLRYHLRRVYRRLQPLARRMARALLHDDL